MIIGAPEVSELRGSYDTAPLTSPQAE